VGHLARKADRIDVRESANLLSIIDFLGCTHCRQRTALKVIRAAGLADQHAFQMVDILSA
jgi:hypothetical protein